MVHIFVSFAFPEKCLVQPDAGLYSFINQGALTVDNIDDEEEMGVTDVSSFNTNQSLCSLINIMYLRLCTAE
jgi:hypothetical protein